MKKKETYYQAVYDHEGYIKFIEGKDDSEIHDKAVDLGGLKPFGELIKNKLGGKKNE